MDKNEVLFQCYIGNVSKFHQYKVEQVTQLTNATKAFKMVQFNNGLDPVTQKTLILP